MSNLDRQRVGLFFGSFDPLHENHKHIARVAFTYLKLDRLLFVVNRSSPPKLLSPYDMRTAAVREFCTLTDFPCSVFESAYGNLDAIGRRLLSYEVASQFKSSAGRCAHITQIQGGDKFYLGSNWFRPPKHMCDRTLAIFPRGERMDPISYTNFVLNLTVLIIPDVAYSDSTPHLSSSKLRLLPGALKTKSLCTRAVFVALVGVPGSGKSTLATALAAHDPDWCHVDKGEILRQAVAFIGDTDLLPLRAKKSEHHERHRLIMSVILRSLFELFATISHHKVFFMDISTIEFLHDLEDTHLSTFECRSAKTDYCRVSFDLVVELQITTSEALSRLNKRGRDGDTDSVNRRRTSAAHSRQTTESAVSQRELYRTLCPRTAMVNLSASNAVNVNTSSIRSQLKQLLESKQIVSGLAEYLHSTYCFCARCRSNTLRDVFERADLRSLVLSHVAAEKKRSVYFGCGGPIDEQVYA